VNQVTRIRHPNVLVVQQALDESRDALAFATEPVFASLANVLGNKENLPDPLPAKLDGFKLHDLEIKYGLVQLCEGLHFLHKDVKMLHRNICPESIVINASGAWKLFGFDFVSQNESPEGTPVGCF
jgi:SCY1-like protein 2